MGKRISIEDMKICNRFLAKCRENGWQVWQMQYRWNEPEGFHAWFMKVDHEDIEVITHNKKVQDTIVSFES